MAVSVHVSEQQFMQSIVDLARLAGWLVYHTHDSRHSTAAGYPAVCLVRGEVVLYAELKSQHGKLTKAQATWVEALGQARRVEVAVWRPADWDAIERQLLHR